MLTEGISVLICTYNGANRIEKTLDHLARQTFTNPIPWEVVIVDNASTDGTAQIAKSFWKSEVPLRIIYEPKLGVTNARITGMNACQHSYIGFIDDDNWAAENWVETAYLSMELNLNAGGIGGPSEAAFESPPPAWFDKYAGNYAVGEQHKSPGRIENPDACYGGQTWSSGKKPGMVYPSLVLRPCFNHAKAIN